MLATDLQCVHGCCCLPCRTAFRMGRSLCPRIEADERLTFPLHQDRHLWDVAPWMYQDANIIAFVAKLNFTLASTFTRLSLICFYYRLIKDSGVKWFKWVLHASVCPTQPTIATLNGILTPRYRYSGQLVLASFS